MGTCRAAPGDVPANGRQLAARRLAREEGLEGGRTAATADHGLRRRAEVALRRHWRPSLDAAVTSDGSTTDRSGSGCRLRTPMDGGEEVNGHVSKKGDRYYVVLELGVDPRREAASQVAQRLRLKATLGRPARPGEASHDGTYVEPTGDVRRVPHSLAADNPHDSPRQHVGGLPRRSGDSLDPWARHIPLRQLDRTAL